MIMDEICFAALLSLAVYDQTDDIGMSHNLQVHIRHYHKQLKFKNVQLYSAKTDLGPVQHGGGRSNP